MTQHEPLPTPIKTLVTLYKKRNNSSLDQNHLVCAECNSWLSEPIYLTKNGHHVCGWCTSSTHKGCLRDLSLEHLLLNTKYPCKYIGYGCTAFYTLGEDHEVTCNYNLQCFCKKPVGALKGLIAHLKEEHKAITLELTKPVADICLKRFAKVNINYNPICLHIGETILIVDVRIQSTDAVKKLNVIIYNGGSLDRDIKCTIKLTCDDTDFIKHGQVTNTLWDSSGMLSLNLLNLDQEDTTTFKLKIYFDNYHEFEANEKIFESMVRDCECPICLEIIADRCYQCTNGHNVCTNCKKKIKLCPICRLAINNVCMNIRNLTSQVQILCKYSANGCFVHNNIGEIKKHEKVCPIKLMRCDICKDLTFDKAGLFEHMQDKHGLQYLEAIPTEVEPGYIKFRECLLKLIFWQEHSSCSKLSWCLRVINGANKNYLYNYTLDVDMGEKRVTLYSRVQEDETLDYICFPYIQNVFAKITLTFLD